MIEKQIKGANINFSKMRVETDEKMLDKGGEPRKDILIYPGKLVCHPSIKDKVQEAFKLFFGNKQTIQK